MAVPAIWAYRAKVERVIDGDTLDVTVDAGFANYRTERLRLLGVNTPERKGATRRGSSWWTGWSMRRASGRW